MGTDSDDSLYLLESTELRNVRRMAHGLATGKLHPVIARTFLRGQVAQAHGFVDSNEQVGKILLTVP